MIDSKYLVFQALNKQNNLSLDIEDYFIGIPRGGFGIRNTVVDIIPLLQTPYYAKYLFEYNRVNLKEFGLVSITVPNTVRKKSDLLSFIKEVSMVVTIKNTLGIDEDFEIFITKEEIFDDLLTMVSSGDKYKTTIEIKPNSYLFYNQLKLLVTVL